jgi:membrane protein
VAYRMGVAAGTEPKEQAGAASGPGPGSPSRLPAVVWQLTRETTSVCFRYRVTGLAAEAGFFLLLSLPPLVLGLVGGVGYLKSWLGADVVHELQNRIIDVSSRVLTADSVNEVITPTLKDVFRGGRFDLISIGFLIALWSGSRALNVFIDTISIMYGLGGRRGIVRTRALSFTLYVAAMLIGSVLVPLVLAGPSLLARVLPDQVDYLDSLYWPVASLLSVVSLTSLYHVSVPVRTPWRRDLPGALLTLVIWFVGSFVVRWIISKSVGGTSIYGPLAAPIVLMIWLYVLAIAVLIGAALNAAVESIWPRREIVAARSERVVATPEFKPAPGMETGEVELPPNRTPPVRPPAGRAGGKKPLARSDDPR